MSYYFTSESVTEGHPDKVCDQISDAVVDYVMSYPLSGFNKEDLRCACETCISPGLVVVMGEYRAPFDIPVESIVRGVLTDIGYTDAESGFDLSSFRLVNNLHKQSEDIAMGVDHSFVDVNDRFGAGDQGMMFGYATSETKDYMPAPIYYAHRLAERLAFMRKTGVLPYLLPDGKTQVTFEYEGGKPVRVSTILISSQHKDIEGIEDRLAGDLFEYVVVPVFYGSGFDLNNVKFIVNPTGRFVVGGPEADSGLTGRKIIVDTYGGMGRHGGGAFSGKDCTKVDRSAAYAARWVAKNIVAAGLAERCEIQVAYAIGVSSPVSVYIDMFGTNKYPVDDIERAVFSVFDLRPGAIISEFDLFRPIYRETAAYGHFGRNCDEFPWERITKVRDLKIEMGLINAS